MELCISRYLKVCTKSSVKHELRQVPVRDSSKVTHFILEMLDLFVPFEKSPFVSHVDRSISIPSDGTLMYIGHLISFQNNIP